MERNYETSMKTFVPPGSLEDLEIYRRRLFAFVPRDVYKGDCGKIDLSLPGYSQSEFPYTEEDRHVTLHVRCNGATDLGRSHYFRGATLADAVKEATAALERWERGEWPEEGE